MTFFSIWRAEPVKPHSTIFGGNRGMGTQCLGLIVSTVAFINAYERVLSTEISEPFEWPVFTRVMDTAFYNFHGFFCSRMGGLRGFFRFDGYCNSRNCLKTAAEIDFLFRELIYVCCSNSILYRNNNNTIIMTMIIIIRL